MIQKYISFSGTLYPVRKPILPVPVLAESSGERESRLEAQASSVSGPIDEARESTSVATSESSPPPAAQNRPRGGQKLRKKGAPITSIADAKAALLDRSSLTKEQLRKKKWREKNKERLRESQREVMRERRLSDKLSREKEE